MHDGAIEPQHPSGNTRPCFATLPTPAKPLITFSDPLPIAFARLFRDSRYRPTHIRDDGWENRTNETAHDPGRILWPDEQWLGWVDEVLTRCTRYSFNRCYSFGKTPTHKNGSRRECPAHAVVCPDHPITRTIRTNPRHRYDLDTRFCG